MGDLISRQAAIDIADDLRDCISVDGYWAWTERIRKLPSAQPELIRCKVCGYYEETDSKVGTCLLTNCGAHPNGYCAWAERREDETD